MKLAYQVDQRHGMLFMEVSGDVDWEGWERARVRLVSDPRVVGGLDRLIDLRGVRRIDIENARMRALAGSTGCGGECRSAVVAYNEAIFGVIRMCGLAGDLPDTAFRVFREMDEALEWLGVDKAAARLPRGMLTSFDERAVAG